MKIIARDDRGEPESADEQIANEGFRRQRGECVIKPQHDHSVDAEPFESDGFCRAGRQTEDRVRPQERSRSDAARR